jgi:hypothetical protein
MKTYQNFKRLLTEKTELVLPEITEEDVLYVVNALGLDLTQICPKQLLKGMKVELEHWDVTNCDLIMTAKIALAHIKEHPKYYDALEKMEKQLKK